MRDIVWAPEKDTKKDLPLALLVHFGNYQGPSLTTTGNGLPLLPIFRSRRKFYRGAINCSRTQFSITIAYAITVHKAQGMTVQKTVLNVTNRDFAPDLNYVAISRVKTLDGILFKEAFDYERFHSRMSDTMKMRIADVKRRNE
jgi:ATP-dependent DNA helicase PIF1